MAFVFLRQAFLSAALLMLAVVVAECAAKDGSAILVRSLSLEGVKGISEAALKNVLATRASSRLPWGTKRYFDRRQFDDDLNRIRAFYNDRGYPFARIVNFDVKLNARQDAVDLTITVDEGEPVLVTALTFAGFEGVPDKHMDHLKKNIPIQLMRPRDRQQVLTSREMALNELRDHGFPYATVKVDEDDGPGGTTASLRIVGEPGRLAHFGNTQVQGNQRVDENVIRRSMTLKPGELYRRSRVQDSQRQLYGMSLFEFVNVEPVDVDQQPAEVPMKVTVAEGPRQRVNFSGGYGTEEQARVDAEYHRLNFMGGARSVGVHARWSSLDKGLQGDFTQPYLFDPHVSLTLQAQQWYSYTPAYQSTVTGGTVTTTYRVRQRLSLAFSVTAEHDSSSIAPDALNDPELRNDLIALGLDPVTGEQNGSLNALKLEMVHSTADNPLNPRRGYQLAAFVEQAGKIIPGTFRYTALSLDGRHYLPIGDHLVFANRMQVANIAAPADDPGAVPFSKKLFLGGATTIRGWGRYEVSPLSDSGLPIGGNSMLLFSSEVRAMVHKSFGVVAFLDGGNVWANSGAIQFGDLRYAVGSGIRYQTPIGPLRFDYGYQLNPIPGLVVNGEPQSRRWRVHFSVGQAF